MMFVNDKNKLIHNDDDMIIIIYFL